MRLRVDQELCLGTGQCVLTAPEVFDQDEDDGIVVLLTDEVEPAQEDAVDRAAMLCPARAIVIGR
ncbi:ferredoxin [uncultured Jatrophihabitans sp.]|uniref:ferredoxin n=1 Tax=uncultured Jatrophihabitans sp. TaxID=1610747 RepID=UPI0035CAA380